MEWKLPEHPKIAGRQLVSQREPVIVADRVATKAALFSRNGANMENACEVYVWALYMRRLLRSDPNEFSLLAARSFSAGCTVRFDAPGELPGIAVKASLELDECIAILRELAPLTSLLEVTKMPHWRLIFPDLDSSIPAEEDPATCIQTHLTNVQWVESFLRRTRELCDGWNRQAVAVSSLLAELKAEGEFWASTFASSTSLRRWYRTLGGGSADEPPANSVDGAGPPSVSMERFETFSTKVGQLEKAWSGLDQSTQSGEPSYLELFRTLEPEFAAKRLHKLQISRAAWRLQIAILECDWNRAVTCLEELRRLSTEDSANAGNWLIFAVNALHAEGDFVNLNMLFDCCGDCFPSDATSLEQLRRRVDKSAKLVERVSKANATRFGTVPKSDLLQIRSFGIDTAGTRRQWMRRRLRVTAVALACSLALMAAGTIGIYRHRDFGSAHLALELEPSTSFDSADVILLARFDPAQRSNDAKEPAKSEAGSESGATGESGAKGDKQESLDPASGDSAKAAPKVAGVADLDARLANLKHAKLVEVNRQIEAVQAQYDDQQAQVQREYKDALSKADKQRLADTDKIQDDFADLRTTRSREVTAAIDSAAKQFAQSLVDVNREAIHFAQTGVDEWTRQLKTSPAYKSYGSSWRVVAKINGQEAFSALNLFPDPPPFPTSTLWVVTDADRFAKFASDQLVKFAADEIVYSINGVNVDSAVDRKLALTACPPLKPIYAKMRETAAELLKKTEEFQSIDSEIQSKQKTNKTTVDDAYDAQKKAADDQRNQQLANIDAKRAKEIQPLEERRHQLSSQDQVGRGNLALAGRAWAEIFEQFWSADGILKSTAKTNNCDFGLQLHGDYQLLVRVKDGSAARFYRADFQLPSLQQGFWHLLIPQKVKVYEDAEFSPEIAHDSN